MVWRETGTLNVFMLQRRLASGWELQQSRSTSSSTLRLSPWRTYRRRERRNVCPFVPNVSADRQAGTPRLERIDLLHFRLEFGLLRTLDNRR